MNDDEFFDSFGRDITRMRRTLHPSRAARLGMLLWAALCVSLSVTVVGVFVWAVIALVTWVTS